MYDRSEPGVLAELGRLLGAIVLVSAGVLLLTALLLWSFL
jgi:hypothetical protein